MTTDHEEPSPEEVEFLFEARDAVAFFEVLIINARDSDDNMAEGTALMLGEAQKLKSLCLHVERPLITLLVHRMSNFLTDLETPTKLHFDDLEVYVDILRGILDGEISRDTDQAEFVRSLPVRQPKDVGHFEFSRFEIMVIDPNKTASHFVERELLTRGYRVSTVRKSFEAFEIAARTLPDMIISSYLLDAMNGGDLSRVLAALPATRDIPFAILTAFEAGDPALENVPEHVTMLHKGDSFLTDMDNALSRFVRIVEADTLDDAERQAS